ncbi:Tify domain containing protein [Trema orientale]|uniref:Tify domain containing protein n=1 Tax=Trema orientale TaxID=63057 RepID=A0A2P5ER71_TREOI|nr:Tify domain containing protein [Trema orientale]
MRKNYSLDTFGVNFPTLSSVPIPFHCQQTPSMNVNPIPSVLSHQQQVTVFFNGRAFVCDMTELQARAIILIASREMEERRDTQGSELALSIWLQSQLCRSPGSGPLRYRVGFLGLQRPILLQRGIRNRVAGECPGLHICVYDSPLGFESSYNLDLSKLQCSSYTSIYKFGDQDDPTKWQFGVSLRYNESSYSNECKDYEESSEFSGLDESFTCIYHNGINTSVNCFGQGFSYEFTNYV